MDFLQGQQEPTPQLPTEDSERFPKMGCRVWWNPPPAGTEEEELASRGGLDLYGQPPGNKRKEEETFALWGHLEFGTPPHRMETERGNPWDPKNAAWGEQSVQGSR